MTVEPAVDGVAVRRLAVVAFVLLAVVVAAAALAQARDDSATYDEPVYVSAGLLALTQHDLDYNAEHPPIAKAIAAIPVLSTSWTLPPGHADGINDERTYSAKFLQAQGDHLAAVTLASRLVPVAELLVVAVLLVLLGRRLVSWGGGLLAGALWLVSPMTLGLGHLDGVDLPFAVAVVVYAGALLHARHHDDRRSTVLLGVALGLCLATSMLGLVLVPVTLALLVVQRRRRGVGQWLLAAVVAWAVLWLSYLVLDLAVGQRYLLPRPFVDGLEFLRTHDTVPANGYLLGQAWVGGQWWFWPGSLLVKLTTPVLLVLLLSPLCWRLVERAHRRDALVVLAVPGVALLVVVMTTPRDLGVRYLLPVLALWCVSAAAGVFVLRQTSARVLGAVAGAVAVVMLVTSLPHSLASTSPPFVPAYRVATDSNVDWGQDLGLLQAWSVGRQPYVAWFGPRGTSYADVPGARDLTTAPVSSVTGWVAVSATRLTSAAPEQLAWLRAYCPVGTLGGSIVLYRFTSPPTADPGPTAPAPPCDGDVSTRNA
jgi:hypothetical protein